MTVLHSSALARPCLQCGQESGCASLRGTQMDRLCCEDTSDGVGLGPGTVRTTNGRANQGCCGWGRADAGLWLCGYPASARLSQGQGPGSFWAVLA